MANFFSKLINKIFVEDKLADEEFYEELQEAMILSDVGMLASENIIQAVRHQARQRGVDKASEVREILREYLSGMMRVDDSYYAFEKQRSIVSVIGVNGVGKTTSIAKLAYQLKQQRKKVILAAADTFRAGAIDQLKVWGQRIGVDVIAQKEGADPAAVVYDALQSFKSKQADVLIIDTAGRLHNKKNLMDELGKINRIIDREFAEGYRESFIVVDATTGQNGLNQARVFNETCDATGIILTKMDGSAKGGIALAITTELGIPVKYTGVGERMEDLCKFDSEAYVNSLFETS